MFRTICFDPLFVFEFLSTDILSIAVMFGIKLNPGFQALTTEPFFEQPLITFFRFLLDELSTSDIFDIRLTTPIDTLNVILGFPTQSTRTSVVG